ncbi:Protein kinase domain [Trypanosoma vivax]|uniref:non-specific serine/threonine protein kinase n=1 Tax=Trypanosoma vivax (strain Y486) TaxID=1055687 RepID=G0U4I1_TRYVY|nr:putative protein kinase [Trypanosoma vivax]KAH8611387.1 Protein kinase domain [Trypanosoma vivax]CCC52345.1 putative protein kinase [Trypanosoma vivax Y486]
MEKYSKVRVLGKGSFGSAILIRRRNDNALFVIKEVFLGKMNKKERMEARQECRVLQQLNHPNIVRYIEHFENRDNLFIVMEYCDGGDLHGKLKRGPMNENTILYYYSQICLAMEYLHSRHILHRDIKTMNIFLMKNGSVKLGDFGIATVLRSTMGMANTVCGTPYYFSPEICRNRPYNNKSDVWALGVLLYELATGRHPFDGNSMQQLMQSIVRGRYPPLPPHFSHDFRKMVDWCLQKDPTHRPSIKQTLGLPIVRKSLERLEEDLMLATQCKVRLKDIIDYEVGSDIRQGIGEDASNVAKQRAQQNNARQVSESRPLPYPPEMSPGKLAAIAVARQQGLLPPNNQQEDQQERQPSQGLFNAGRPYADQPSKRPLDNAVLLGPKPIEPGVVVDCGRVEMYRRYLQQQYQRRADEMKAALYPGKGGEVIRQPPIANPPYQRQQQYKQREQQNPVDCALIHGCAQAKQKNEPENRQDVAPPAAVAEGFEERMKRINAIVERYAKNVDPKAINTIHAYMKRKQEEYLQRHRMQQERAKHNEEKRRRELAKVIEYQNKIGRGEKIRRHRHEQQQQHQHQQKPSPRAVVKGDDNDRDNQGARDKQPPRLRREEPLQNHVFGRDPRYVQCPPRDGRGFIGQDEYADYQGNALDDRRAVRRGRKRAPVLAANSPSVAIFQQPRPQRLHGVPQRNDNGSPREAVPVASPRLVVHRDMCCNMAKKVYPTPPTHGGDETASPVIPQSPPKAKLPPHQAVIADDLKRPQQMLRLVSAPTLPSPICASPNGGRSNPCECNMNHPQDCNALAPKRTHYTIGRRNSAPSVSPVCPATSEASNLNDNKNHLAHPSAVVSYVSGNLASPRHRSAAMRSPSGGPLPALNGVSPVSVARLEDLPADVAARRRFEEQRRQLCHGEVPKQFLDSPPGRKGDAASGRPRNNEAGPNCAVEQRSVADTNMERKKVSPSSLLALLPSSNQAAENVQRKRAVFQPPPLAPLQIRPNFPSREVSDGFANVQPLSLAKDVQVLVGRQLKKRGPPPHTSNKDEEGACATSSVQSPSGALSKHRMAHKGQTTTDQEAPSEGHSDTRPLSSSPLLLDVIYGVSCPVGDDVSKNIHNVNAGSPGLPSLAENVADPPDVAQQWRCFADNGHHKMACRPYGGHMQLGIAQQQLNFRHDVDTISGFHKGDVVPMGTPCTLEALCSVPESFVDNMSLGQHSPCSASPTPGRDDIGSKGQSSVTTPRLSSPNDASGIGKRAVCGPQRKRPALSLCSKSRDVEKSSVVSIVHDNDQRLERPSPKNPDECSAAPGGALREESSLCEDKERSMPSIPSVDQQQEASLDGYIAMLDHLRGLLYHGPNDKRGIKLPKSPQQLKPLLENLDPEIVRSKSSAVTPGDPSLADGGLRGMGDDSAQPRTSQSTHAETDMCHGEEGKLGEGTDPSEFDDDESDDETLETSTSDEDFEDAVSLSPLRCAVANDPHHCFLDNPQYLPQVPAAERFPPGCVHAGEGFTGCVPDGDTGIKERE